MVQLFFLKIPPPQKKIEMSHLFFFLIFFIADLESVSYDQDFTIKKTCFFPLKSALILRRICKNGQKGLDPPKNVEIFYVFIVCFMVSWSFKNFVKKKKVRWDIWGSG